MRLLAVLLTVAALALPLLPAVAQQEATPTVPLGVSVELLPAEATSTPATPEVAKAPAADQTEPEEKIELAYDGALFSEVLKSLADRLKVLVVCDDEKLLNLKYYHHQTVPESNALTVACGAVVHYPRPAWVLCADTEVRESKHTPQVKADPQLKVKLEDAVLADALRYISEIADVGLAVTPSLAKKKVTFEAEKITVSKLMEALAGKLNCACTTGFSIENIPAEKMLDRVEKMSDQELERVFSERLQDVTPESNPVQQAPEQVRGIMDDSLRMFGQLEPADRQRLVNRGVQLVQRFAAVTKRLSPETQQKLRAAGQPALALGIGAYIGLPSQTRGELAPLMKALRGFGW